MIDINLLPYENPRGRRIKWVTYYSYRSSCHRVWAVILVYVYSGKE